jgi:hypothetical protein
MAKRSESQLTADREYRANNPGVLVRFSKEELALIDAARGEKSRPEWIQANSIASAKQRVGARRPSRSK